MNHRHRSIHVPTAIHVSSVSRRAHGSAYPRATRALPDIIATDPAFVSTGKETDKIDVRLSYRIVRLFSEGLYSSPKRSDRAPAEAPGCRVPHRRRGDGVLANDPATWVSQPRARPRTSCDDQVHRLRGPLRPAATTETRPALSFARLTATVNPSDVVERARRYLAGIEPAVAGQNADLHTFRVCCRIARGFALSDEDSLAVLRNWHGRCEPPWSERELRDKLLRARKNGREFGRASMSRTEVDRRNNASGEIAARFAVCSLR